MTRSTTTAASATGAHPLVIVSHGYPGNRFLMSHIAENLASKGFVVAAADHPDSTYGDQKAFASTLYNRPLDQLLVLDEVDRLSRPGSGSFLSGLVDVTRTGLVGYSVHALRRRRVGQRRVREHPAALRDGVPGDPPEGEADKRACLDVVPRGGDAVYALDAEGRPRADHTHWKGFKPRTATALMLEHLSPER